MRSRRRSGLVEGCVIHSEPVGHAHSSSASSSGRAMTWAHAQAKVEERRSARRAAAEQSATKLQELLHSEHYRAEIVEDMSGWGVRLLDPRDERLGITLRYVAHDGDAQWTWISPLPPVADADDFDRVLCFVRNLLGTPRTSRGNRP